MSESLQAFLVVYGAFSVATYSKLRECSSRVPDAHRYDLRLALIWPIFLTVWSGVQAARFVRRFL